MIHYTKHDILVVLVEFDATSAQHLSHEIAEWGNKYGFNPTILMRGEVGASFHDFDSVCVCAPGEESIVSMPLLPVDNGKRVKHFACAFLGRASGALPTGFDLVIAGRGSNSIKWACRWLMAARRAASQTCHYGPEGWQVMNVVRPHPDTEPIGGVIVFHGGFWRPECKLDMTFGICADLARRRFVVWNVEYANSTQGGRLECLHDIERAAKYITERSSHYKVSPSSIAVVGHSVGGFLALHLGTILPSIRKVWALAPLTDLLEAKKSSLGEHAIVSLVDREVEENLLRMHSPAFCPAPQCPVQIFHGDCDDIVPMTQSSAYVKSHHGKETIQLSALPGVTHMDICNEYGDAWKLIATKIEEDALAPRSANAFGGHR